MEYVKSYIRHKLGFNKKINFQHIIIQNIYSQEYL